jgi:hypothetical protein
MCLEGPGRLVCPMASPVPTHPLVPIAHTMRTYTPDQLKEILHLHQLWRNDPGSGRRANLDGADLSRADLRGANLSQAKLLAADLPRANLFRADLTGANLFRADLTGADLTGADLTGAYLSGADLTGAYLSGAKLSGAKLSGAKLSGADLRGADLSGAELVQAELFRVHLNGANLTSTTGLPISDDAPDRLLAVAKAALASPDALEMSEWHTCETTHCICGWAEHLGGPLAKLVIEVNGNDMGGLMLLGVEAHSHFRSSNGKARAFLQSVIVEKELIDRLFVL